MEEIMEGIIPDEPVKKQTKKKEPETMNLVTYAVTKKLSDGVISRMNMFLLHQDETPATMKTEQGWHEVYDNVMNKPSN